MDSQKSSLRELIDKWMSFESAQPIKVTRLICGPRRLWRGVCVEALRASGSFSLVLFRHEDGSWRVYPPEPPQPVIALTSAMPMVIASLAA